MTITASVAQPSVVELAELCDAVYSDRAECPIEIWRIPMVPRSSPEVRWRRSLAWSNQVGFFASVYVRDDGRRVLVFRGSDDGWDFLLDDVAIAAGGVPPQVIAALEVCRRAEIAEHDIVTGHSLGGALALLVGVSTGSAAVSFNAPGVADACGMIALSRIGRNMLELMSRCRSSSRVLNIRVHGDPVSSPWITGDQVGPSEQQVSLRAANCSALSALCRHSMGTVISSVRANASYYAALSL